MATMSATDVKNRFGEALETAQREPVTIRKNGRNVAVLLSAEEYQALAARGGPPKVRPIVAKLLAESIEKHDALYKALAR
jgi:prevent-host-death family protein